MTDGEKEVLRKQYMHNGCTSSDAWRKVNFTCKMMRLNYYKRKKRKRFQRQSDKKSGALKEREKKAFREGLK